jgi:hypothetical protein
MATVSFKVKNKKYSLEVKNGEDFLISLDKFLKKNKIDRSEIKSFKVDFLKEESLITKRIISIIIRAINLSKKVW